MAKYKTTLKNEIMSMNEWIRVCGIYADKINATLVYVDKHSCIVEYADGSVSHIHVKDMLDYLKKENI